MIKCPGCLLPVIWKKLKPYNKKQSQFIVTKPALAGYEYACACGLVLDFHKDFIRDEWQKDNPHRPVIRLL